MIDGLLKVQEVAVMVDSSVQTINLWYKFKREHPDHELAKEIPDYEMIGRTRCWTQSAVIELIQFKSHLPQGRKGVMGAVTQKYVKKKEKPNE